MTRSASPANAALACPGLSPARSAAQPQAVRQLRLYIGLRVSTAMWELPRSRGGLRRLLILAGVVCNISSIRMGQLDVSASDSQASPSRRLAACSAASRSSFPST